MRQRIVIATVHHGLLIPKKIQIEHTPEITYVYNDPLFQALIAFIQQTHQKHSKERLVLILHAPDLTLDDIETKYRLGNPYVAIEDLITRLEAQGIHPAAVMTAPDTAPGEILGSNYKTYADFYRRRIYRREIIPYGAMHEHQQDWHEKIEHGKQYYTLNFPVEMSERAKMHTSLYKKLSRSLSLQAGSYIYMLAPDADVRTTYPFKQKNSNQKPLKKFIPLKAHTEKDEKKKKEKHIPKVQPLPYPEKKKSFHYREINLHAAFEPLLHKAKIALQTYLEVSAHRFWMRHSKLYHTANRYLSLLAHTQHAHEQCFVLYALLAHMEDNVVQKAVAAAILGKENPPVQTARDQLKGYLHHFILSHLDISIHDAAKSILNNKVIYLDQAIRDGRTSPDMIVRTTFPLVMKKAEEVHERSFHQL